jgi:hypothetical protein
MCSSRIKRSRQPTFHRNMSPHLQGASVCQAINQHKSGSTMEPTFSSNLSVDFRGTTRRYITENTTDQPPMRILNLVRQWDVYTTASAYSSSPVWMPKARRMISKNKVMTARPMVSWNTRYTQMPLMCAGWRLKSVHFLPVAAALAECVTRSPFRDPTRMCCCLLQMYQSCGNSLANLRYRNNQTKPWEHAVA